MSCHGVSHLTSSEGVASFHFSPRESYLFANVDVWPLNFFTSTGAKVGSTASCEGSLITAAARVAILQFMSYPVYG